MARDGLAQPRDVADRREIGRDGGLQSLDGRAQRSDLASGGLVARDGGAQRVETRDGIAQRGDVRRLHDSAQRRDIGPDRLAQLGELVRGGQVGDAGAQRLGLALELLDPIAGDGGVQLLAQGIGARCTCSTRSSAAASSARADERSRSRSRSRRSTVAASSERIAVRGLLVLGAHRLELRRDVPAFQTRERGCGTRFGGGDRLGEPGVGGGALTLERSTREATRAAAASAAANVSSSARSSFESRRSAS